MSTLICLLSAPSKEVFFIAMTTALPLAGVSFAYNVRSIASAKIMTALYRGTLISSALFCNKNENFVLKTQSKRMIFYQKIILFNRSKSKFLTKRYISISLPGQLSLKMTKNRRLV